MKPTNTIAGMLRELRAQQLPWEINSEFIRTQCPAMARIMRGEMYCPLQIWTTKVQGYGPANTLFDPSTSHMPGRCRQFGTCPHFNDRTRAAFFLIL